MVEGATEVVGVAPRMTRAVGAPTVSRSPASLGATTVAGGWGGLWGSQVCKPVMLLPRSL